MRGDREWMYKRLQGKFLNPIFTKNVDQFVEFACSQENVLYDGLLKCPCVKCDNVPLKDPDTVKLHLYQFGFCPNYYQWIYHGEECINNVTLDGGSTSPRQKNSCIVMVIDGLIGHGYHVEDVGQYIDVEEEPLPEHKKFFDMLKDAEKPLYDGCNLSLLSVAARITNIKCEYNVPHKAIDNITSLIKEFCPDDNKMTDTFYKTRKLLNGLELPHQKIDVCPNGCMLFWKEHSDLESCLSCHEARYYKDSGKGHMKQVPRKVLTYFAIAPRLQRLYATESTAGPMRWHAEHSQTLGSMSHPSDGEAWKHFDETFPSFASEPRNVRLGLCTDGFSPFGKSGKRYSCWPVILTPYNLPPSLCMKKPFLFLSLIIPGPTSPKGKLDIYLQPLIEELKLLWEVGVPTYDVLKKQNFQLKAALLWTISDFPAYGMLFGWSTCGKLACPYCMENTKSFHLCKSGKETWFDCHRQFLPHDHAFRQNKSSFYKNREERGSPPQRLSGEELHERLLKLLSRGVNSKGKIHGYGIDHHWLRQSISWQLPYWSKLLIRHNLDVMHIEKNVFDNLFHTIMDVNGKTKDILNARRDLKHYCKRRKLEPKTTVKNGKSITEKPFASYVLSKEKRKALCEWVQKLKFPDGYVSNLGRCVDKKEFKLFGMKSHDCHVFMQRLLPVALKELLPVHIWNVVTELSQFFRDISSTTLYIKDMERLEKNIPEILCKLEKIFPPSFFNSMEHLPVHLFYEEKVGGPVQYRWMYCFERILYHLKKKVGNKARVEGSICKAYLTEEISNFCSHYFDPHVDTKSKSLELNVKLAENEQLVPKMPEVFSNNGGYSTTKGEIAYMDEKDLDVAHQYVLSNCGLLSEYESVFEEEMRREHSHFNEDDVFLKFQDKFSSWLSEYVKGIDINDDIVISLASGPSRMIRRFKQYYINGYLFHTYNYGKSKPTMNYGVCVKGVKGENYYGILQDVIELEYIGAENCYKVVLFKCVWFDSHQGMRIHEKYQLVDVNHLRRYPKYDPFGVSIPS